MKPNNPQSLYPKKEKTPFFLTTREELLIIILMALIFAILLIIAFQCGGTESGVYYNKMEYLIR